MNDKTTPLQDIADIRQEAIAHEIIHPKTGENLGIRVNLLPTTDERVKKLARKLQDERNRLAQRGKAIKTEQLEEFRVDVVVAAMTGWEWYGNFGFHGEKPEFNTKNIRRVCNEKEWFLDQIDEKLAESKDFFID